MSESYKKQLGVALLVVGLLFVSFIMLAFCYFHFFPFQTEKKVRDFVLNFKTSDILTIENKLPVTDSVGKAFDGTGTEEGIQGYVEFSLKNNSKNRSKYVILLTKQKKEKEISSKYVKFYLTDEKDVPFKPFDKSIIPSYSDFYSFSNRPGSRVLYKGVIDGKTTLNFKLRVWLSDTYVFSEDKEYFSIDVDVQ